MSLRPGRTAKENRRKRANERAAARSRRSAREQLVVLDTRPGSSARERARLEKELA